MLLSSGEITPPCGTPCLPLALSITFSRRITSPSSTRLATFANSRSCRTLSNEDTTDYPFPRRSDFSGDHPQAPSLPRKPPRRDQRAHSARRAVVVGGAARRQPIPHSVSLDGLIWELRRRPSGRC